MRWWDVCLLLTRLINKQREYVHEIKVILFIILWTSACVKSLQHKEMSTFLFFGTRSKICRSSYVFCLFFCTKDVILYDRSDLNCFIPCIQTANGNVEAKVVCLFRRRDISGNLNTLADSNASEYQDFQHRRLHVLSNLILMVQV